MKVKLIVLALFSIGLAGLQAQTLKDIDGNVYKTVTIGEQVWMAENLKTTKYNDGTAILLITDDREKAFNTPTYCWYNNDTTANKNTYGALYNWYTVTTNKLCPIGWHVPSDAEWTTLSSFLGGQSFAGGKLKETGTTHWENPNTGATNESSFTALPGGCCRDRRFGSIGYNGYWWSSTVHSTMLFFTYSRYIDYNYSFLFRATTINRRVSMSVRCLRDF